ncbi:hypothetical protein Hanom_Chr03g00182131 [Helianthus anomalus]
MDVEKGCHDKEEFHPVESDAGNSVPVTEEPVEDVNVPVNREEEVFLVTPNQLNAINEIPILLERNEEVINGLEDFVPGNQFDFGENIVTEADNVDQSGLINKRKKKNGLGTLGRPNPAYSSSLEKTKVGKKPKCQDDLFGLDPLLGLDQDGGGWGGQWRPTYG